MKCSVNFRPNRTMPPKMAMSSKCRLGARVPMGESASFDIGKLLAVRGEKIDEFFLEAGFAGKAGLGGDEDAAVLREDGNDLDLGGQLAVPLDGFEDHFGRQPGFARNALQGAGAVGGVVEGGADFAAHRVGAGLDQGAPLRERVLCCGVIVDACQPPWSLLSGLLAPGGPPPAPRQRAPRASVDCRNVRARGRRSWLIYPVWVKEFFTLRPSPVDRLMWTKRAHLAPLAQSRFPCVVCWGILPPFDSASHVQFPPQPPRVFHRNRQPLP